MGRGGALIPEEGKNLLHCIRVGKRNLYQLDYGLLVSADLTNFCDIGTADCSRVCYLRTAGNGGRFSDWF